MLDEHLMFNKEDLMKNVQYFSTSIFLTGPTKSAPNQFDFSLNSHGFRSDEFINHHSEKHIVFSGCSDTFGWQSPDEETWPKIVYEKLNSQEKYSGFFRLAVPGTGYQEILRNVMIYIENFGAPNKLVLMFPHLERRVEPNEDGYFYTKIYAPHLSQNDTRKKWSKLEYSTVFFEFKERMILFEKYCKALNIDLKWTFYMDGIAQICNFINEFDNYFYMGNEKDYINWMIKNFQQKDITKENLWRPDGHQGKIKHAYWAQKVLEVINV